MLGMNRDYIKDEGTRWFGFEVAYNNASNIIAGQNYTNPQLNGNIAGVTWKSRGDQEKRKYDYTYDAANRLTGADFNQYTNSSFNRTADIDYSVSNLSYDANGNILSMTQKGVKISSSSTIDYLSYSYNSNSNQLQTVTDTSNNFQSKLGDFKYDPSEKTATDYLYDDNGNLTRDRNKSIDTLLYNYLNLPSFVSYTPADALFGGVSGNITYVYDATGNKLQKIVYETSHSQQKTTTTTYVAGFVYESIDLQVGGTPSPDNFTDSLMFTGHEEGRIRKKGTEFVFDYFIKDHLGNIRMVLTEE
jgi:hypothetical protein